MMNLETHFGPRYTHGYMVNLITIRTSFYITISLGQEQVWTYAVLSDHIHEMLRNRKTVKY